MVKGRNGWFFLFLSFLILGFVGLPQKLHSQSNFVEICDNFLDDDGDNLYDCDDPDCANDPACNTQCSSEVCTNNTDDDCDGLVDCADSDCSSDPSCTETACSDTQDNDGDGLTDCQDSDCASAPNCLDTDLDGFADAVDNNPTWFNPSQDPTAGAANVLDTAIYGPAMDGDNAVFYSMGCRYQATLSKPSGEVPQMAIRDNPVRAGLCNYVDPASLPFGLTWQLLGVQGASESFYSFSELGNPILFSGDTQESERHAVLGADVTAEGSPIDRFYAGFGLFQNGAVFRMMQAPGGSASLVTDLSWLELSGAANTLYCDGIAFTGTEMTCQTLELRDSQNRKVLSVPRSYFCDNGIDEWAAGQPLDVNNQNLLAINNVIGSGGILQAPGAFNGVNQGTGQQSYNFVDTFYKVRGANHVCAFSTAYHVTLGPRGRGTRTITDGPPPGEGGGGVIVVPGDNNFNPRNYEIAIPLNVSPDLNVHYPVWVGTGIRYGEDDITMADGTVTVKNAIGWDSTGGNNYTVRFGQGGIYQFLVREVDNELSREDLPGIIGIAQGYDSDRFNNTGIAYMGGTMLANGTLFEGHPNSSYDWAGIGAYSTNVNANMGRKVGNLTLDGVTMNQVKYGAGGAGSNVTVRNSMLHVGTRVNLADATELFHTNNLGMVHLGCLAGRATTWHPTDTNHVTALTRTSGNSDTPISCTFSNNQVIRDRNPNVVAVSDLGIGIGGDGRFIQQVLVEDNLIRGVSMGLSIGGSNQDGDTNSPRYTATVTNNRIEDTFTGAHFGGHVRVDFMGNTIETAQYAALSVSNVEPVRIQQTVTANGFAATYTGGNVRNTQLNATFNNFLNIGLSPAVLNSRDNVFNYPAKDTVTAVYIGPYDPATQLRLNQNQPALSINFSSNNMLRENQATSSALRIDNLNQTEINRSAFGLNGNYMSSTYPAFFGGTVTTSSVTAENQESTGALQAVPIATAGTGNGVDDKDFVDDFTLSIEPLKQIAQNATFRPPATKNAVLNKLAQAQRTLNRCLANNRGSNDACRETITHIKSTLPVVREHMVNASDRTAYFNAAKSLIEKLQKMIHRRPHCEGRDNRNDRDDRDDHRGR